MFSNLRVAGQDEEGTHVHGVFHVSRYRDGITDIFMGRVRYRLVKQGDVAGIPGKLNAEI